MNANVQQAALLMATTIENLCFSRWVAGDRCGGAATFRQHCLNYFQPNVKATEFLDKQERTGNVGPIPGELYLAILEGERKQFEKYTDAEAEAVLATWRKGKGTPQ